MAKRIKFFLLDLDGCVSEPFTPPDWSLITQLRALSALSQEDPNVPKISICTGRPGPYTEAVGQWLAVDAPVIFESGAGALNLQTQEVLWHPDLPDNALSVNRELMLYIQQLKKDYPLIQPEVSKQIDACFTCADTDVIAEILPNFRQYIAQHYPQLAVHHTEISISAQWPQANKGAGLAWFCQLMGIECAEVAFIGDTSADISAIEKAGVGFAPRNANTENKTCANWVTEQKTTAAVIEAWHYLIAHNKKCE